MRKFKYNRMNTALSVCVKEREKESEQMSERTDSTAIKNSHT